MKQPTDKTLYARLVFQRGLSLIELMISITIGLLILVSLSTLFINQSKTRVELDKSNRMIDNGRYALELLSSNLRLAGYYGEMNPVNALPTITVPGSLPDPCDPAPAAITAALGLPIQGVNATTTTTPVFSTFCAAVLTANAVTLKPGSDILVIRRASTVSIPPASAVGGTTYLQVSSCPTDTINYKIATAPSTFPLLTKNCATLATQAALRPFLVQVYFVSIDNNSGDRIPTLKRLELDPTGNFVITPLVEGIEYMQIDYGVDNAPVGALDGVADTYTDCSTATPCSLTDWSNVVSVKINIVARNQDSTKDYSDSKTYNLGIAGTVGPFNAAPYNATPYPTTYPKLENYKRHAYTELVRLVNPAGRRETP